MRRATASALLVISILSRAAIADDTHYQDYPLGGRSVGLGGAFTALADDPSGIFFNPAGIVDASRTSVQISTTLYGLEISDSFFSAVQRAANLKTVFTELNVIPSSASFTTTLGDLGPHGRPEHAYGFGAFVPSFRGVHARNVSALADGDQIGNCTQLAYQRNLLDRTFYFGGAYGYRIDELLRAGVSAFVLYRSLRDQEETSCIGESLINGSTPFATAQTDLDVGVAALVLALGFKADVGNNWSVGVTVSTPSIRLLDTGGLRVTRGSADPASGTSDWAVEEVREIEVDSRVGTSIRAGVAYVVPRQLTFVADATLHAPVRYRLFSITTAREDLEEAITLVSDVERRLVVNLNTGAEYLVSRPFSISGGLFTNFSSAPSIPGVAGERFAAPRLPHVTSFGGSFVLGFFSEHTLTRAGITLSYGSGDDVVPRNAGVGALGRTTEWVKVELSQLFLFFFISSTFRY